MADVRREAARLITSLHILHQHKILNQAGTVSIRNPSDRATFITSTLPPVLVSSLDDLSEWSVDDTALVRPTLGSNTRSLADPSRSEMYAHSGIYKQYSGVGSIVHARSSDLVVYGLCDANGSMLRSVSNQAGFVDEYNPIFDPAQHRRGLPTDHPENLKIDHPSLGTAMAASLSGPSNGPEETSLPKHDVAFVRGNGAVTWSHNLEDAVGKAINLHRNAYIQTQAMLQRYGSDLQVTYLTKDEARDCQQESSESSGLAWVAWATEVSRMPMYRNDVVGLIW